jgi:hypothetical protein
MGMYLGVRESLCCEIYDGSMFRLGNVWLRGLWKLLPGGGSRECCEGSQPELLSGENVKGVVGLAGPPEKDEGAVSVKALFRDVVLCELECL